RVHAGVRAVQPPVRRAFPDGRARLAAHGTSRKEREKRAARCAWHGAKPRHTLHEAENDADQRAGRLRRTALSARLETLRQTMKALAIPETQFHQNGRPRERDLPKNSSLPYPISGSRCRVLMPPCGSPL